MKPFLEKDILYMDQDLILVHKKSGMAVQSAKPGQMDLEHALLNVLAKRQGGKSLPYLAVIHRLDQPVEGIVVFGRNKGAAARLSAQLGKDSMKKEYLAVVSPEPREQEGILMDYLLRDGRSNTSSVVDPATPGCKKAELSYRVRAVHQESCLLEVRLGTGRHHQIRVQLSHMGCPIVGDSKYGSGVLTARGVIALCAHRLSFTHPTSGKKMFWEIRPEAAPFLPFLDC